MSSGRKGSYRNLTNVFDIEEQKKKEASRTAVPETAESVRPASNTAPIAVQPYQTAVQPYAESTQSRTATEPSSRTAVQPYKENDPYKGKHKLTVRVNEDKILRLKAWCAGTKRPNKWDVQDAVEKAIDLFMAAFVDGQPYSRQASQPYHDHDQISRLIDDLIDTDPLEVYRRLTGNEITAEDRVDYETVKGVPPIDMKFCIAYSVRMAKEKVGKFRYCLKVIRDEKNKGKGDYFENEVMKLVQEGKVKV